MSVKSDGWIKKMAKEFGMIEPFQEGQVNQGVISYGVSSYGYDIRVGRDFKVFTNAYGATVDPKAFDPKAFIDIATDTYITIPPNSFALARTVEYFRIPRNVITICLGKSTYARCFRGDTRVALVDGTSPTLEEMAVRSEKGEDFWGYSLGSFGRIVVTLLEAPRYIGRDSLIEVILDSGESIFCTPDHRFFMRDGRVMEAGQLRPGTSLMPLYRDMARGYEMLYQPLDGYMFPTHRLADEWNLKHGIYEDMPNTHRHHIDHDRRNNRPWNITRMDSRAHIQHHNHISYGEDFDPQGHSYAIRGAARMLHCDRSVFNRFPEVVSAFRGNRQTKNHKVANVRELSGDHDVYCLTVPEEGNFALESGVFVGNCGIIVNVTPFEPEWEGFVTLEISNTTPLPAKIYANEGIAQVLFLESDEICEVSYADKKGKYQKQTEITLPKLVK
ncbi:MAG: dCTP deaminase [Elusimicrobia bacterium]|nr:dCTP deaminase [Elusimicrobiota bacterium]